MSTHEKIIAARRIVRLTAQKESLEAFLEREEIKTGKKLKIDCDLQHSVTIDGTAFELICKAIQNRINQINQEIYDTVL